MEVWTILFFYGIVRYKFFPNFLLLLFSYCKDNNKIDINKKRCHISVTPFWLNTMRILVLLRIFGRIIVSLLFHHLLNGNPHCRLVRPITPWDIIYSLIIQLSSILRTDSGFDSVEVFGENTFRLAVILCNELLVTM